MRRAGKPQAALDKLLPLRGKLIDAHARAFLNEELSTSALAAKQYGKAIDLMLEWLHEAGVENRSDVREKLVHWVASIPMDELLPILDKRRARTPIPQTKNSTCKQRSSQDSPNPH